MKRDNQLKFRLVPNSGVTEGTGFRAEWEGKNKVLGLSAIVAEAQAEGVFGNLPADLACATVRSFFDVMIRNVLRDGRTRTIDGYLQLSLKLHGSFKEKTDDFDESKHKLVLVVQPLGAFGKKRTEIRPVNADRVKQFRLNWISAADGRRQNHQVTYGRDFVVRGSNLAPGADGLVTCTVVRSDGTGISAEAEVLEQSSDRIRCAWPADLGEFCLRRTMWVSLGKNMRPDAETPPASREISADVLPG